MKLAPLATKAVTALALAIALACAALVIVPGVTGVRPVAILSGSMEPTISAGDAIIVKPYENVEAQAQVGDIVTFQPRSDDPYLVTHRIIGVTVGQAGGAQFTTQGDANGTPDEPLKAGQIMGKTIMVIPYLGHLISMSMASRMILAALVIALVYAPSAVAKRRAKHTSKESELVDN